MQTTHASYCDYYGTVVKFPSQLSLDGTKCFSLFEEANQCKPDANGGTAPTFPRRMKQKELPPPLPHTARVVVISDTHTRHREMTVPAGDILLHCGDVQDGFAILNREKNLKDFFRWFSDVDLHPHAIKVVIAGNHDSMLRNKSVEAIRKLAAPALYLQEESCVIQPIGLRLYGTPRSVSNSRLSPNTAFQSSSSWAPFAIDPTETSVEASTEETAMNGEVLWHVELEGRVPRGPVDILLTHQSLESVARCPYAKQRIVGYVQDVAPQSLHVCGHLHGARGFHRVPLPQKKKKQEATEEPTRPFIPSINAAMLLREGLKEVVQAPAVVDIEL
ncbi:metallophosphoesterase domain-containing protein [Angomonas deanei]|uniref:Calcineurin-like phosphoesterase, putative n=1 Tax=Angomonas deanei TaxID=59799 RepID=A0A7G2C6N4_9TRYP|nr:metallophosphoesterase domain-containing protein [Angomonas deanei]CAD2214423.1 Calcineurin-like phosphoesterase, putative [Angomonas deanei]|eukprot:EPY33044.1 metallophosphoesterase domain-containing protein [Angomonas deanei]